VKKEKIIRAWTDPEYRATLSEEELAALPANPAGLGCEELPEADLRLLTGADVELYEDAIGPGIKRSVTLDCSNSLTCQFWSWLNC
jgi:mersacidin/lichenicidin family type 2 lantibiotic